MTIQTDTCAMASWQIASHTNTDILFELRCHGCGYVHSTFYDHLTGDTDEDADAARLVGIPLRMRHGPRGYNDAHDHDLPVPSSGDDLVAYWNGPRWHEAERIRSLIYG